MIAVVGDVHNSAPDQGTQQAGHEVRVIGLDALAL
jgi:hypothetical protein